MTTNKESKFTKHSALQSLDKLGVRYIENIDPNSKSPEIKTIFCVPHKNEDGTTTQCNGGLRALSAIDYLVKHHGFVRRSVKSAN